MEILEILERVTRRIAPGRSPSFTEAHVLKALEDVSLQGTVGRLSLSKLLELGGGEIRTLVKHLKLEQLIEVSRSGVSLSPRGRNILLSLRSFLSEPIEVPPTPLTVGPSNTAVKVRGVSDLVRYGLEQRDAAILAGAKGATTLIFSENKLSMADTEKEVSSEDEAVHTLLSKMTLENSDVIVIGSADTKLKAELGAKMAAIRLLESRNKNQIAVGSTRTL